MVKWVAKLSCDHNAGGQHAEAPQPAMIVHCQKCNQTSVIMDVITNEPLRPPPREDPPANCKGKMPAKAG